MTSDSEHTAQPTQLEPESGSQKAEPSMNKTRLGLDRGVSEKSILGEQTKHRRHNREVHLPQHLWREKGLPG